VDLLIGACALELGYAVVTGNLRDFGRVPRDGETDLNLADLRRVPFPRFKLSRSTTCSSYKILYTIGVADSKPVEFRGSSLEDLRAFPLTARREAGHQLDQVQNGREPDDWKPMNTVGRGTKEIRIQDEAGAFRVLYLAKFADAVYVLHCFQKKTEKTSKADVGIAAKRFRDLLKELGQ
jgi:phage-related protein